MEAVAKQSENGTFQVPIPVGKGVKGFVLKLELVPVSDVADMETKTPVEGAGIGGMTPAGVGIEGEKQVPEESRIMRPVLEIGKRLEMPLRMTGLKKFRNDTTTKYAYEFRDEMGNLYRWITYRDKNIQRGKIYPMRITVKKFRERKGIPIIDIARCKIL